MINKSNKDNGHSTDSKKEDLNNNIKEKSIFPKLKPISGKKQEKIENKEKFVFPTLKTVATKIGAFIDKDQPVYGSKFIETIGRNKKLNIYSYPLNAYFDPNEKQISILFVGQSGVGKSTFINAYLNHLLGISKDDNIRYKIIFEDKNREKDQTQSQTDKISIYNIRSPKYGNKLFKLIDTPGAGDTRGEEEEKKFLKIYNKLFNEEIKNIKCITFVIKSSENRENEFQKKILKTISSYFTGDSIPNFLAILTHSDNDELFDAVGLLEKSDIFKNKTKNGEEWYFPVSSVCYFRPFDKKLNSITKLSFILTERSMIKYTRNILDLKNLDTNLTGKNLSLKNKQEQIYKNIKENTLINYIKNKKDLQNTETNLETKINELNSKKNLIKNIENDIKYENEKKKLIKENLELEQKNKKEKENEIDEINKDIQKFKEKNDKEKESEIQKLSTKIESNNGYIKEKTAKIQEIEVKVKDIDLLINNKEQNMKELTKLINEKIEKEINDLKNTKINIVNALNELKLSIIKQFLTMKIIFDEINKITLNKMYEYTVIECLEDLWRDRKLIDERQYILEVYNELKEILGKLIDEKNINDIIKIYQINRDDIINNENK